MASASGPVNPFAAIVASLWFTWDILRWRENVWLGSCTEFKFRKKFFPIWSVKTSVCQKRYGSHYDWSLEREIFKSVFKLDFTAHGIENGVPFRIWNQLGYKWCAEFFVAMAAHMNCSSCALLGGVLVHAFSPSAFSCCCLVTSSAPKKRNRKCVFLYACGSAV